MKDKEKLTIEMKVLSGMRYLKTIILIVYRLYSTIMRIRKDSEGRQGHYLYETASDAS